METLSHFYLNRLEVFATKLELCGADLCRSTATIFLRKSVSLTNPIHDLFVMSEPRLSSTQALPRNSFLQAPGQLIHQLINTEPVSLCVCVRAILFIDTLLNVYYCLINIGLSTKCYNSCLHKLYLVPVFSP